MNTRHTAKKLVINRCPEHADFWAVSIDDDSGGVRLTSPKCCGRWCTVKEFALSPEQWDRAAEECQNAAEDTRQAKP